VFNVGGSKPVSLLELARLLVEVNGGGDYVLKPFPVDRRPIDIGHYYADDRRLRAELGWEPRVPLDDGLSRTLAYYRDAAPHYWTGGH
jgi:UDP-glucose 4-epimerase